MEALATQQQQKKSATPIRRSHASGGEQHAEVRAVLRRSTFQAKPLVGWPDDPYEKEADRTAEQVVKKLAAPRASDLPHSSGGQLQYKEGKFGSLNEEQLSEDQDNEDQMDAFPAANMEFDPADGKSGEAAPANQQAIIDMPMGQGYPMSLGTRRLMETAFGEDFSAVRIHTNAQSAKAARALYAKAFTLGNHVVFGQGLYSPQTSTGRKLLAHELTHVLQQRSRNLNSLQRQDEDETATVADQEPEGADEVSEETAAATERVPQDEPPRHRRIDYQEATKTNRFWFSTLQLRDANPLHPYDPYRTPNAFINRVVRWQDRVNRRSGGISFAEFVFAAQDAQAAIRDGGVQTVLEGIPEVQQSVREGTFRGGGRLEVDGVLGARTYWTMLAASSMSTSAGGQRLLQQAKIPIEMLKPLSEQDPVALQSAWRAVHAYLFNRPRFRTIWPAVVRCDLLLQTFERLHSFSEVNRAYLTELFFPYGPPESVDIEEADLIAILARGYMGESVEGIASIFEVQRTYFHWLDVERLVRQERSSWRDELILRMAEVPWSRASFILDELGLQVPTDRRAQEALEHLQGQQVVDRGTPQPTGETLAVLAVAFRLPEKDPQDWTRIADQYVIEKELLAEAAEEATREHLTQLEQRFERRMQGRPDIGSDDAMVFLQLLVGDTFTSAQKNRFERHRREGRGHDVEFVKRLQPASRTQQADRMYTRARKEQYLIVQLGEDRQTRFPLSLRQIEQSRNHAAANGADPLPFDMIDTPHAAMHMYLPTRFTARATDNGGSEAASNPYRLRESDRPRAFENWKYFTGRLFGPFEPVLVEIREFNPEAGQLVRSGRQLFGTDRIFLRYVWTLGGSLVQLNEQLWDAQETVNLFGWIDAVLTIGALATVVAAPLIAGTEAAAGTAATQVGRAAVTAAARRALYLAVRRFIIGEAIGEALGRATFYINDDPDLPEGLKTAWNGLMIALLIYGVTATTMHGIRSFRNRGSVHFRRQLEVLEAELEAELRAGRGGEVSAAEEAAQADIRRRAAARHRELVEGIGGEAAEGPARVRSDDPRAAGVSAEPSAGRRLTSQEEGRLRDALGEEAADTLAESTNEVTRRRLAAIEDPDAIRKLHEVLSSEELPRVLAGIEGPILRRFAAALDSAALRTILQALSGSPNGMALLRAFAPDPQRLSRLLDALGARTLLGLAENPGAARFWRFASRVDPAAVQDALRNMGRGQRGSLARFRNLVRDVGPELAADVLNTYTGREIRSRWRRRSGMTAAQNVARLAIQRKGVPTVARGRSGVPIPEPEPRPRHLDPEDFRAFFAVSPERTAPATVRNIVELVQAATARAANHLDELIDRAARGMLTDADLAAVPPNARATVEAFLRTGPGDANHHALYGSALQYLAEAALRDMNGGTLPQGMAIRRREVRQGGALIPDAQVEITLQSELRYPQRNTTERFVVDWTTPGEAGKITKYVGGNPPVTYAVEIIQPGPPQRTQTATLPPVTPSMPTGPPDTETTPESE